MPIVRRKGTKGYGNLTDLGRVVQFDVTEHPIPEWTAAQLMQALPWDTAPRYLLRDRDRVYGDAFRTQAANMAITEASG